MAIFAAGITEAYVVNNAQARLSALRRALQDCANMQAWLAGIAQADLVALGFSAADATALLSAMADASALNQVYATGQAPATYPQVTGTPYVYAASQRAIMGPLT